MTVTTLNLSDFDLDEIIRWRDYSEEFDPEEYGFEGDTYPDDFIHGEGTVAWTEYTNQGSTMS